MMSYTDAVEYTDEEKKQRQRLQRNKMLSFLKNDKMYTYDETEILFNDLAKLFTDNLDGGLYGYQQLTHDLLLVLNENEVNVNRLRYFVIRLFEKYIKIVKNVTSEGRYFDVHQLKN